MEQAQGMMGGGEKKQEGGGGAGVCPIVTYSPNLVTFLLPFSVGNALVRLRSRRCCSVRYRHAHCIQRAGRKCVAHCSLQRLKRYQMLCSRAQGFDKYKDDALNKVEGYVEGAEVRPCGHAVQLQSSAIDTMHIENGE